ncbi:hypothetical protein [Alloalcanivorax xenomutans]|uniref:hypothetical protein n=1 Tax=Alloalcanivorax xenomutans TaxID=1094342 RepID=UPI003008E072
MMRILLDGIYFGTGDDLSVMAEVTEIDVARFSFHPDDYRAYRRSQFNVRAEQELAILRSQYPESEILSWDKQEREARLMLADPNYQSALLSGIAVGRGITVVDLRDRVIAKADAYTAQVAAVLGRRQALEDQLSVLSDWQDMAALSWD